jgi:transcriptional regulator with XRE-family HTH domain
VRNLRRVRQSQGYSALDLARAAGVPVDKVEGWEAGTATFDGRDVARVSEALGVNGSVILGGAAPGGLTDPSRARYL